MDFKQEMIKIFIDLLGFLYLTFLIIYRKNLGKYIYYYIASVALSLSTALLEKILVYNDVILSNQIIFNMGYLFLTFLLLLIYFYKKTTRAPLKRLQFYLITAFIILYLGFSIFDKFFYFIFPINFYFLEILILLASISIFLYQTFNTKIILNIKNYFPFWICLGLIIEYCGLLPILFFSTKPQFGINMTLFFTIMFFINFIAKGIVILGTFSTKN